MTLKGSERRAVVLKTPESAVFEEAVFLMRSDRGEDEGDGEEALVRAAGRIVEENLIPGEKKRRKREKAFSFFLGFLLGLMPGVLVWLLSRF